MSGEEHAREFLKQLRAFSVNKDDPLPEWTTPKYVFYDTFEETGGTYCICKKKICNIYSITNKNTNKTLTIGSDCAERWFKSRYNCETCKSPLGNIKKRLSEKNFICPACARASKKQAAKELKEARSLLGTQFRSPDMNLPYYPRTLGQLLELPSFCNTILNLNLKKYPLAYQRYIEKIQLLVKETWDIQEGV
jgi:ribosomal protein L37AE/L43A